MKTKIKILSIFLLAIMVFGLTGCGKTVNDDKDSNDNNVPTTNKTKEFSGYTVGSAVGRYGTKNGMVVVKKDGYYGVIDIKGNIVVECDTYTKIYDYSNGVAMVEKNGKYGYIDTKGEIVIPLEYDDPYGGPTEFFFDNDDDVTWMKKNGNWAIVNKKGEVIKEGLDYGSVSGFRKGYATVDIGDVCIDAKGNEVDDSYCDNRNLAKEPAKYRSTKNEEGLYAVIDENDKAITDYKYKYMLVFYDGAAKATLPDGTIEIINENGEVLLRFKK